MAKKIPRRTAERILEESLVLFNRYGEPHVSTNRLSAELGISPGNLYYHYPSKSDLIQSLSDHFESEMTAQLVLSTEINTLDDAWVFMDQLFTLVWKYRFLYRDLNDLLSKHRRLETQVQSIMERKTQAMHTLMQRLNKQGILQMPVQALPTNANCMTVLLTYWLSFEYATQPRSALQSDSAVPILGRAVCHVMGLLSPYLASEHALRWQQQADAYNSGGVRKLPQHTPGNQVQE